MSNWNKNYHWKTKNAGPWTKEYFTSKLVGTSHDLTSPLAGKVEVESLATFEGDVELGNRKGKLITIYDCQITLNWLGTLESGTEAKGTIFFPEVSHEVEDDGEEYRVSITQGKA
jgi:activator of HSP90 ATPase